VPAGGFFLFFEQADSMNAKTYRRVRIAVGAMVLGFCALVFADVAGWIPPAAARAGLWLQFVPSLSGLAQGLGWVSAGCLLVVVATLVFGRIYCAMACPLGVLMDFSAWLADRTGKNRRLPYRKGKVWLRVMAPLACVAGWLVGSAVPAGFLDPYSLFGKITAATLRPMAAPGCGKRPVGRSGGDFPGGVDHRRGGARLVGNDRRAGGVSRPRVVQHRMPGGRGAWADFQARVVPAAD
jgi:hypothetical protein